MTLIPKKVYNALHRKQNFDYIFLELLREYKPEQAYEEALKMIRQYAPKYKHYKDYDSYRAKLHFDQEKGIEVPQEIIDAVTAGIDKIFQKHYKNCQQRKRAYELTVLEIQEHFPNYKPCANYQAFKSSQSIRHKKRKKA